MPTAEELDEWGGKSKNADDEDGVVLRELRGDCGGGEEAPAAVFGDSAPPSSSAGGLFPSLLLSAVDCPEDAQRGCGLFFSCGCRHVVSEQLYAMLIV